MKLKDPQGLEDHRQADASASTRREKITGKAQFGIDVQLPGMLTARRRAPAGLRRQGQGVRRRARRRRCPACARSCRCRRASRSSPTHFWAAKLGRDALEVDWDLGAGRRRSTRAKLREEYRALARSAGAKAAAAGDVDAALARREDAIEAEYDVPVPRARADGAAQLHRDDRAGRLRDLDRHAVPDRATRAPRRRSSGSKPEQVRIHTTFLGGGFGRRANPTSDFVAEAVQVAKAAGVPGQGRLDARGRHPRRLLPADVRRTGSRSALGRGRHAGRPGGSTIVGQSILAGTPFEAMMIKNGIDETSVEGVVGLAVRRRRSPNHLVELHSPKSRGAGPLVALGRALAHARSSSRRWSTSSRTRRGRIPLEYRRALLRRRRGTSACSSSPPRRRAGASRCRGPASAASRCTSRSAATSPQVAEVSVEKGRIRVHRVVVRDRLRHRRQPARACEAQMRVGHRVRPRRRALRRDHAQGRARRSRATSTTIRCCA